MGIWKKAGGGKTICKSIWGWKGGCVCRIQREDQSAPSLELKLSMECHEAGKLGGTSTMQALTTLAGLRS